MFDVKPEFLPRFIAFKIKDLIIFQWAMLSIQFSICTKFYQDNDATLRSVELHMGKNPPKFFVHLFLIC